MSKISISRTHSLTRARAVKMANRVAEEVAAEYGIVTTWNGYVAYLRGADLSGRLTLAPKQFHLELELGFFAVLFRDQIASGIEGELDRLLLAEAQTATKTDRSQGSDEARRDRRNAKTPAETVVAGSRRRR
ncbi:MAG TPA: polyhydroxyalkanoic acid system family protein [Roseiarcus sp.]|nr:polyhydroxyalkanoic acid system family protein [Roseiarcus sp.]